MDEEKIGRVTIKSINVYSKPSDKSKILSQRFRDELVNIYDEILSDDGPDFTRNGIGSGAVTFTAIHATSQVSLQLDYTNINSGYLGTDWLWNIGHCRVIEKSGAIT